MCGIVGYIGPRDAAPILLEGLARLEYRGYDSAGIAPGTAAGDLFVEKKAGKLANLRTALVDATPAAAIGLAHTRWATHGRPNDLNADPHVDCSGGWPCRPGGGPGRLVAARLNVPLIVGLGDGESFLASDVAAVLAHTNRVVFLEEGDVADLTADGVTITGGDGVPRGRLRDRH